MLSKYSQKLLFANIEIIFVRNLAYGISKRRFKANNVGTFVMLHSVT